MACPSRGKSLAVNLSICQALNLGPLKLHHGKIVGARQLRAGETDECNADFSPSTKLWRPARKTFRLDQRRPVRTVARMSPLLRRREWTSRSPIELAKFRNRLGRKLRIRRESREISQTQLAAAMEVSVKTINGIECGENLPSMGLYAKLSKFFGAGEPGL